MPDPAFCSLCGKKLKAKTQTVDTGFDTYTGKARHESWAMLVCPDRVEPDNAHDRWEQNPSNPDGVEWDRWNG